jgi:hypothetical protein
MKQEQLVKSMEQQQQEKPHSTMEGKHQSMSRALT